MFKFKGGQFVTHQISNLSGIIDGVIRRDTGNIQYSVQPLSDGDSVKESFFVDADYLILDDKKSLKELLDFNDIYFKFKNGQILKSRKTGITGYVYGEIVWLTGCVSYCVTRLDTGVDGKEVNVSLNENECISVESIFVMPKFSLRNFQWPRFAKPLALKTRASGGPMVSSKSHNG